MTDDVAVSGVELSSLSEEGACARTRRPMSNPARALGWRTHAKYMGTGPPTLGTEGVAPNKWFRQLVRRGVEKGLMPDSKKCCSVASFVKQPLGKLPG